MEKLNNYSPENNIGTEAEDRHEIVQEYKNEKHEQKIHTQESIDKIAAKVEQQAKSAEQINVVEKPDFNHHQAEVKGKQNHSHTKRQTISRAQRHLKPAERRFSKIIHNPAVEIASDITGATIARPYGLLWGGVFSLLSSFLFYVFARHYGYEYPFSLGILFFLGGFVFGLLLETLFKLFKKQNK